MLTQLTILTYFIILAYGLVIGSFLNVCIYRIPKRENIAKSSHCMSCGRKLGWRDMVPVFSYIILRGRCRTDPWREKYHTGICTGMYFRICDPQHPYESQQEKQSACTRTVFIRRCIYCSTLGRPVLGLVSVLYGIVETAEFLNSSKAAGWLCWNWETRQNSQVWYGELQD